MNKTIIIYLGSYCNNSCIMCSIEGDGRESVSRENIIKKIKDKKRTADQIYFTGGEPTEHPKILKFIEVAGKQGYEKISISTNGKNFSDPNFASQMVDLGLTEASITLHGTEKNHNEITGGENNYKEALQGLKNLMDLNVFLTVDSVLMKMNIRSLPSLWKNVYKLGIRDLVIQDLVPERGQDNIDFEDLMIPYPQKKYFFYKNIDIFRGFNLVHFTNFPRCVLPARLMDNLIHTSNFEKEDSWKFDGLDNTGTEQVKKKIAACKGCSYAESCYGFRVEKLDKFGEASVLEMLKIDDASTD